MCDYFLPNALDLGNKCKDHYELSIVSVLRALFAGGIEGISGKRREAADFMGKGSVVGPAL